MISTNQTHCHFEFPIEIRPNHRSKFNINLDFAWCVDSFAAFGICWCVPKRAFWLNNSVSHPIDKRHPSIPPLPFPPNACAQCMFKTKWKTWPSYIGEREGKYSFVRTKLWYHINVCIGMELVFLCRTCFKNM